MRHADDTLTTARLRLRRFTEADLDELARLHADPAVMRWAGGTRTREQTWEILQERVLAYYDQHPGLGVWALEDRATGCFIGLHLLNYIRGESYVQVGYRLLPAHWGRGYATEMCVAVLRYGFEVLALPQIVAITDQPNVASQRVLLKAGLRRNGERAFAHPAYVDAGLLAWFEADREPWLAAQR